MLKSLWENRRFFFSLKKRLGYIGWLHHGNLGDEAMFEAFKRAFPDFTALPFKSSSKIDFWETLTRQRVYRAVFLGGGTLINSNAIQDLCEAQKRYLQTFVFGSGAMDPELLGTLEDRPVFFS